MTQPRIHLRTLIVPALLGAALFAAGPMTLHEPLGVALWAVVAAIVLLPLDLQTDPAREFRICHKGYLAACVAVIVGVAIVAGGKPAIVIAAVAGSLAGGVEILRSLRVPATLSIAVTMAGAALSFTWPIWMAGVLSTHDLGPWLQRLVNISPSFALNAAISPESPLTHRPLGYRLMNLGQDVSYAMPPSVWPCVMLHSSIGVIGWIGRRWTQMNADVSKPRGANDGHPEGA